MTRAEVIRTLWRPDECDGVLRPYLFAVIDAAADERIYPKLIEMQDDIEVACLYKGEAAQGLATVAPYLLRLDSDLKFFDWWWENGWGNNWGIFAWSTASFETVYEHFRRHTKVRIEGAETVLFRFYDPRTANSLFPILDSDQRDALLGPVTAFHYPDTNTALGYLCR